MVHVGKCAGDTFINALSEHVGEAYNLYQLHCFDSDERLKACLALDPPSNAIYVVCTREPVSRFVSSFNWDKHFLYGRGKLDGSKFAAYYEEFATIEALVQGLRSPDLDLKQRATEFRHFSRMLMGQAWYTPMAQVLALPASNTYLCDVATLREDIDAVIASISDTGMRPDYQLHNNKTDFREGYPDGFFSTALSDGARQILREELSEGYAVLNRLRARFGFG